MKKKMKGFMHIIEVVFAVILIFFVFTSFAKLPSIAEDWSKIKLKILANDVLNVLDKKNIDWFNETVISNEMNKILPSNIIYSVSLQNVIKPKIKIGCFCKGADCDKIDEIFSENSFVINDVNVSFDVVKVNNINELFSLDFDISLIYGYEDLTYYESAIRNFLSYDKGIMEIANIKKIDNVQKNIFGLDSTSSYSSSSSIMFSKTSKEIGNEINKIYEYFINIPVFFDDFKNVDKWYNGEIEDFGAPLPSLMLESDCYSPPNEVFTKFFRSFKGGEIDFDVYLEENGLIYIKFAKSGENEYLVLISSNSSFFSSFYKRSFTSFQPIGENYLHIASPNQWHRIKIIASGGKLTLYIDGEIIAIAQTAGLSNSNISFFSSCKKGYVDNIRITFNEDKYFENFLENENTTQKDNDQNKVLLEQQNTKLPACIINYNIVGKGRSVWISNSSNYASEDYKTLIKALIVWLAGDEYKIIKAEIKDPVDVYIYKPFGKDMLQIIKIVLKLGYLY